MSILTSTHREPLMASSLRYVFALLACAACALDARESDRVAGRGCKAKPKDTASEHQDSSTHGFSCDMSSLHAATTSGRTLSSPEAVFVVPRRGCGLKRAIHGVQTSNKASILITMSRGPLQRLDKRIQCRFMVLGSAPELAL